jgi:hypothetical protein
MRPARLVSRQRRLIFFSFTTVLALSVGAGLLIGRGLMLLFFIGSLFAVIALFLGIGLWCGGEDPDDEPRWIAGMMIALLAVVGSVSLGLPKVYQDWRGEPVAAWSPRTQTARRGRARSRRSRPSAPPTVNHWAG